MSTKLAVCLFTLFLSSISTIAFGQNVGIGTSLPKGKLEVAAAPTDSVAFKVSENGTTKLKVTSNGGTAIGTVANPPANGLAVKGVIQPGDSIKSATRPIYIASVNDSIVLMAAGSRIILSANGAVTIRTNGAAGITLDAGAGNVTIKGNNVNLQAINAATLTGTTTNIIGNASATITATNTAIMSPVVRIGGDSTSTFLPAARVTDIVVGNGYTGTITTGSSKVLIAQ